MFRFHFYELCPKEEPNYITVPRIFCICKINIDDSLCAFYSNSLVQAWGIIFQRGPHEMQIFLPGPLYCILL